MTKETAKTNRREAWNKSLVVVDGLLVVTGVVAAAYCTGVVVGAHDRAVSDRENAQIARDNHRSELARRFEARAAQTEAQVDVIVSPATEAFDIAADKLPQIALGGLGVALTVGAYRIVEQGHRDAQAQRVSP